MRSGGSHSRATAATTVSTSNVSMIDCELRLIAFGRVTLPCDCGIARCRKSRVYLRALFVLMIDCALRNRSLWRAPLPSPPFKRQLTCHLPDKPKIQKNQYKLRKINKKCILPLFSAWKIAITSTYTSKRCVKDGIN